jgi:putative aldouronate transport system substrate-binding protein
MKRFKMAAIALALLAIPAFAFAQSGKSVTAAAVPINAKVLKQLGLTKNANGTYKFTKPVNITVEVFDRGLDGGRSKPEDNFYTNWIKTNLLKDCNINIKFSPVGRWTETQDINNLLAAGNAPTICYSYDYSNVLSYAQMGGITDLNGYINKYKDLFPNIWNLLGNTFINYDQDPKTGNLWAIEGKITSNAAQSMFVRQDWLDKLGLKAPTTLDQFHSMLVAFKNNAQKLLGKDANKIIPYLTTTDVGWNNRDIITSYIPTKITEKQWYTLGFDDRRLTEPSSQAGDTSAGESMARLLNKWYNEGLVWKDFALYSTAGDNTWENMVKAGYVGAFGQNYDVAYRNSPDSYEDSLHKLIGPDANFVAVSSFPADNGKTWHIVGPSVDRKVFFPSNDSQKQVVAGLLYLNWLYQTDHVFYIQYGDKGVTYTQNADGSYKSLTTTGAKIMNSPLNIDYTMLSNGPVLPADKMVATLASGYPSVSPKIVEDSYYASYLNTTLMPNFNFGAIDAEQGMGNVLQSKRDTLYAQAITAKPGDFQSVWDKGYKDYLSSGGQAIIDERTSKWNATYPNNDNPLPRTQVPNK